MSTSLSREPEVSIEADPNVRLGILAATIASTESMSRSRSSQIFLVPTTSMLCEDMILPFLITYDTIIRQIKLYVLGDQ